MTDAKSTSAHSRRSTRGLRWGTFTLLLASSSLAVLALTLLLLPPTAFAALYGDGLYPAFSTAFSLLTSWTTLPLGLAIVPISCGIFLWRTLAPGRARPLGGGLIRMLLLAVLLLSLYLVVWGANYRRPTLLQLVDVAPREVTQMERDAFASELLAWVKTAAVELEGIDPGTTARRSRADASAVTAPAVAAPAITAPASEHGVDSAAVALSAISSELELLSLEIGWPASLPPRVKLLPPGTLLSSGYAGMLFPFTLEPQVDAGLSKVSRVAVGAHELAHAAGFAAEADADLAAVLAGLRAPHPLARYATALSLLSRSLDALSTEQRSFIVANLPERALLDLREARDRSRRFLQSSLAARVSAVYNRLLKGQGIEAGVDAYEKAPSLAALLAAEGLLPPPPPLLPGSGVDDSEAPSLALSRPPSAVDPQLLATRGR